MEHFDGYYNPVEHKKVWSISGCCCFGPKNEYKVGGKLLPQLASHGNMLKLELNPTLVIIQSDNPRSVQDPTQ